MNKIVFDVDDTICDNNGRDYENAIPFEDVINKINDLHKEGFYIVLYTSRGMMSCKGDIKKIIAKNKAILEKWLMENNVNYDELIFGKPIADLYVDDKAMSLKEFKNSKFEKLAGGSGSSIYRLGNIVKKELKEDEVLRIKEWYKNNNVCKCPKTICFTYNSMYMEFVEGICLSNVKLTIYIIKQLFYNIYNFRRVKYDSFNLDKQIEILDKNKDGGEIDDLIKICKNKLLEYKDVLNKNASFSHGDSILSNIIYNKGEFYFLDPQFYKDSSSYLLDLAKLNMSLHGYERIFGFSQLDISDEVVECYNNILNEKGLFDIVTILTLMYILRLYRYKNELQKTYVLRMAKEFMIKNERLFNSN